MATPPGYDTSINKEKSQLIQDIQGGNGYRNGIRLRIHPGWEGARDNCKQTRGRPGPALSWAASTSGIRTPSSTATRWKGQQIRAVYKAERMSSFARERTPRVAAFTPSTGQAQGSTASKHRVPTLCSRFFHQTARWRSWEFEAIGRQTGRPVVSAARPRREQSAGLPATGFVLAQKKKVARPPGGARGQTGPWGSRESST